MHSSQASSTLQTQVVTNPARHQYACLRCRARRVRCDKILTGCAHCASHAAQCVYSARRPRKTNKPLQHQTGQRSPLPVSISSSTLTSDDTGCGDTTDSSKLYSRASELTDPEDEQMFISKELRNGLDEASKVRDEGICITASGHDDLLDEVRCKEVRVSIRRARPKANHSDNKA
jgi:hypothetical protein